MKLTVLQWEKVQDGLHKLPEDDSAADALFNKIEQRTWGKRYQAGCAIALTKDEQRMVDEIVHQREQEGRFSPSRRD